MRDRQNSKWQCVAAMIARFIVELWPDETKDWGRAFAGELPEIRTPFASLHWLVGGIMLLTRERFRHAVKSLTRPFGVASNSPLEAVARTSLRVPRTRRIVTLSLLLASLAILLHPEVRAGLSSVFSSIDPWYASQWHSVRKLQKVAATSSDPKLLAVLSLLSDEEKGRLADQAIARDSSLVWLNYQYFLSEKSWPLLSSDRVQRLRNWDPDNAVVRLISAESLFHEIAYTSRPLKAFVHRPHQLDDFERAAAAHQRWLAAMDDVFSAPKYDTYGVQRFQLVRDVVQKYRINDPDIVAQILASQRLPNLHNIVTYVHILLYRATEAADRGDTPGALAAAWKALHFVQRMQLHPSSLIESLIAAKIGQDACETLQPLLEKAGRADEAALVGFELTQWKAVSERAKWRDASPRGERRAALAWASFTVHAAAFAIAFFLPASLAALALLWWKTGSTVEPRGHLLTLCGVVVELAPLLLLFATATFFFAYHPYMQTYWTYLDPRGPLPDAESMEGLMGAAVVGRELSPWVDKALRGPYATYDLWLSATVLLSALAAFFIYRMLPRRRAI